MMVSFFVLTLGLYSIEPIVTVYVSQLSQNSVHVALIAGLVFSASGVASMIAAPQLGKLSDKIGPHKVILFALIFAGIVYLPQAFVKNPWQLLALRFMLGLATAGLNPSINSIVKKITPSSLTGRVYGLSMSRFMADNDHPDQLVLSLYGMIAIGMTPGTYVSGEAISVVPVYGAYYRSMYMPPNSGANASYLETLRQMLVHERRGTNGAPVGLDLAFSTPRAWLASGKTISAATYPELRYTTDYNRNFETRETVAMVSGTGTLTVTIGDTDGLGHDEIVVIAKSGVYDIADDSGIASVGEP